MFSLHVLAQAALPLAGGAATCLVFALAWLGGVDMPRITRDATTTTGEPWTTGAISLGGIALQAGAGATALFVAWAGPSTSSGLRRVLLATGALIAIVAIDDAFLVHEKVATHVPSGELLVACGYATLTTLWCVVVRPWRPGLRRALVGTAFGFLGAALAMDTVRDIALPESSGFLTTMEDALKLAGVILLSTWVCLIGRDSLRPLRYPGRLAPQ